jgi:imidazole glycerol phosphate synthase glutamine amidotransferase subunit
MGKDILVVRTGTANLASVMAGLSRAGAAPELTDEAARIASAARVMVPGVGAFGATLAELRKKGLDTVLQERLAHDRPTMGICMGMQLFSDASEESPGVTGLGVLPVHVRRFPATVRVPQLGWNTIRPDASCRLLSEGYAYYANSYHLPEVPAGWQGARSEHGVPFVAALERGNALFCQFHPELSGPWGVALMRRWLEEV